MQYYLRQRRNRQEETLEAIVERIPPPVGSAETASALIFDAQYDFSGHHRVVASSRARFGPET
jgi:translation elongation factor EF-4